MIWVVSLSFIMYTYTALLLSHVKSNVFYEFHMQYCEKIEKPNLIYGVVYIIIDALFGEDSHTTIILIHTTVAFQKQILESH